MLAYMRVKYAEFLTIDQRRVTTMTETRTATITSLLVRWNHVTAPYILRTDHEHLRCRQIARAIENKLRRLGASEGRDWREFSNGSRWPLTH